MISLNQATMLVRTLKAYMNIETNSNITSRLSKSDYYKILHCTDTNYKGNRPKQIIEEILKEAKEDGVFKGEHEMENWGDDVPDGVIY